MNPSPTNDTDSVNHPGVSCLKSGKWVAKIRHPIRKVWVLLGIYSNPREAEKAYTRKKLEYKSHSLQDTASASHTNFTDFEKHLGIMRTTTGNWSAQIKHKKVQVWLGSYNTPNEAADAYNLSKLELGSRRIGCSRKAGADKKPMEADVGQSEKLQKTSHAYYRAKTGRWRTEIGHPIEKGKKIHLGTFATAEEAQEAYSNTRREFDLMFPGDKKLIRADAFTEEAYKSKMCDVDLMVLNLKRRNQLKGGCEADAVMDGKCDSTSISDDPCVSTRVRLRTFTQEAEEAYNNNMCEFDLMVSAHNRNASCESDAIVEVKSYSARVSDEPSISSRADDKMSKSDFMVSAHKKQNQPKGSCEACEADSVAEGKSDYDLSVSTEFHLGTFTEKANEAYNNQMLEFDSMDCVNKKHYQSKDSCEADDPVSTNGSSAIESDIANSDVERRGEFDLGIIDCYGMLIGEYSSLDDELWIC